MMTKVAGMGSHGLRSGLALVPALLTRLGLGMAPSSWAACGVNGGSACVLSACRLAHHKHSVNGSDVLSSAGP